jgi:hypothetical protein
VAGAKAVAAVKGAAEARAVAEVDTVPVARSPCAARPRLRAWSRQKLGSSEELFATTFAGAVF